jgi:hypothetical protein
MSSLSCQTSLTSIKKTRFYHNAIYRNILRIIIYLFFYRRVCVYEDRAFQTNSIWQYLLSKQVNFGTQKQKIGHYYKEFFVFIN